MNTQEPVSGPANTSPWHLAAQLARQLSASGSGHVPTGTMLDYAYGGLDDELIEILHGDHLSQCATCRRAVDVYRRERPMDPACLADVPELAHFEVEEEVYELSPEGAGRKLRDFISDHPGELLLVAGEANPAGYNAELGEVLRKKSQALRKAGQTLPCVICGPAMGLDEEIREPAQTVLPALAEEGLIRLFVARHRQRLHFRVSGSDLVYTEKYHEAGNASDRHGFQYRSRPIADLFRRRFQALLDSGLARPAGREDFVYLPMDTIRRIQEREKDRFDAMTAEDLASSGA